MRLRSVVTTNGFVFALVAVGGCGSDPEVVTPRDDATLTDVGGTADATADIRPTLTPCEDNTDCAGGEVRRDGSCRQSCESSDDCSGELLACDGELGYCVIPECDSAADCSGGFTCDDFRCVPIDDIICAPGAVRCSEDGGAVLTCNSDGTIETEVSCGAQQICLDGDGGPSCRDVVCTPNDRGCLDATTALLCDSTGTEQTELPCDVGEVCVAGACLPRECVAGSRVCVGDTLVECNEGGTERTETSCSDSDQICTGSGATAACADRVCEPDSIACDATGSAVITCDARGSAETSTACPDGTYCTGGLCLEQVCVPGASTCDGDDVVTCDATGTAAGVTESCSPSLGCDEGACVRPAASLGSACDSDSECPSGSWCSTVEGFERCSPRLFSGQPHELDFVYVPAGTFEQGTPGATNEERPYTATLTRSYFVSRTEITQGQWKAATGGVNPSCIQNVVGEIFACTTSNSNDNGPVDSIAWYSALAYANWLSSQNGLEQCYTLSDCSDSSTGWYDGVHSGCTGATFTGLGCTGYRLLTESEWERAARGGTTTTYYWGDATDAATVEQYGWFLSNSGFRTQAVGQKVMNAYGLYDMSGNVGEFVWDWVHTSSAWIPYPSGNATDYLGESSGSFRGCRGGGFFDSASDARSANRTFCSPAGRGIEGFRLARTVP